MLFTSPVFLFFFLPAVMASYIIVPKKHKKRALLVYNAVFCVCANFHRPINILLMISVIMLAYVAGVGVGRDKRTSTLIRYVSLMVISLLLVRGLASLLYIIDYDYYPLGISVYMLSAISYICDIHKGEAEAGSFTEVALYISFFPVLICGPFIKYRNFIRYTADDEISLSSEHFSRGILLFALGFIKRIGISAVLVETYETLIPIGETRYSIILLLVISSLMFLAIYFAFSGYSDMAVGLAYMLGISIPDDGNNIFVTVTSPSRYISGFLTSLGSWMDEYVRQPVANFLTSRAKDGKRTKYIVFVSSFLRAFCIAAWFKSDLKVLLMIVTLLALIVASEDAFLHGRKHLRSKLIYIPSAIFTFVLLSLFWSFMRDGGFDRFFYDLAGSSILGFEEQLYEMVSSLFSVKTMLSFIAGAFCLAVSTGGTRQFIRSSQTNGALIVRTAVSAVILLVFMVCILIYLPQYPIYSTVPFKGFAM